MIEVVLVTWMAAVGALLLSPFRARLRWGIAGLAIPTGAALYVLASLALLAGGVPFSTPAGLGLASLVAAAIATIWKSRDQALRSQWAPTAATVAGTAVAAMLFRSVHLTRVTVDSARYLMTADAVERMRSLDAASVFDIRMRQLVTPLLHGPGVAERTGYSASITPLFMLSGIVLVGWLAWQWFERLETPTRTRWMLLTSVLLLVVSTNRFLYHAFYINGHMFFAVFLLTGAGGSLLAAAEDRWEWLVPAGLAFAALVPLRPEGAIVAAIFLVPFLVSGRIAYARRWLLLAPLLLAAGIWNGLIWPSYASASDLGISGPVYGGVLIAAGLAAGLGLMALPAVHVWARWGPAAVVAVIGLYLGVSGIDDAAVLRRSLEALGANLAIEGLWGTLWWILPVLVAGAWLFVSPASPTRMLLVPLPIFGLALLSFAYLRGGAYRIGTGDSGSRMLLHVTLVAALAVLLAAAEAGQEAGTEDQR